MPGRIPTSGCRCTAPRSIATTCPRVSILRTWSLVITARCAVEAGADATGSTQVDVYIPIQVEVPYGREYRLIGARVYYMVDDSASIDDVRLRGRNFATGDSVPMGYNTTGGTSTTFAYEEVAASTTYYTVTTTMALTNVLVGVNLPNTASTLYIYGVRLQLDSSY